MRTGSFDLYKGKKKKEIHPWQEKEVIKWEERCYITKQREIYPQSCQILLYELLANSSVVHTMQRTLVYFHVFLWKGIYSISHKIEICGGI
jgi:hypothetical protein